MNSPEESAVRDLGKFTANVMNGMLDMHHSAAALIRYSFQVRTLKDVVRRGSENDELINQIFDSLHHILIYCNEEIPEYAKRVSPAGLETRKFSELFKRMDLLYQVWLAMSVHEDYQEQALTGHVDATRETVQYIYNTCRDNPRWNEVSRDVLDFFIGRKEEENEPVKEEAVEPTLFARDDGVVSSVSHEQANSDEEGKKKQFLAKTEKVLTNFRANNPDFKTMRELVDGTSNFRLEGIYTDNLMNEFISIWDVAIDHQSANPEEKFLFSELLRKIFFLMVDKRRNDFAAKLFDKYKNDADSVLPCLENFIENFQSGLTQTLNKLPLDANLVANDTELFNKSKDPLMWYLLVSPVNTLHQLMNMCIDHRGYVPIVIRICRFLPTLFDRSVHITPIDFEHDKKDQLLISMLNRVFMLGRRTWTSSVQWENAGFMAMSFTKSKKDEKALLDSYSMINFCVDQLVKDNREPMQGVKTFIQMLQRLLANNNNSRMLANYRFSNSFRDSGENVIATPILINLMFELLVEYDGVSPEISEGAADILKSIGGRLKNDEVVFDDDTTRELTEQYFNEAPWWIKYSIFNWCSSALQNPKMQVPSGVFQSIPDPEQDGFEQIMADQSSMVVECFLRSLFELGLFDVDLSIQLLHTAHNVKIGGNDVVEKIALALVESYGKKLARKNAGLEIGRLISEMLTAFDPIRDLVPLKSYSNSYFHSIKKVENLLVMFKAARIAREKQICATRIGTEEERNVCYDEVLSLTEVSDQLMDLFCESTKAHIEKEAAEVTKLKKDARALVFSAGVSEEKWKVMNEADEREQSFILQLTMLFLNCSHFTKLYQNVPIKLQHLMNVTLDRQFDSQKSVAKRVMDDSLTEQRKTEVVYAFVEPVVEEKGPEVVVPVKASDLLKNPQKKELESESTSTEKPTFPNGGEHRYDRGQNRYRGNGRKNYSDNDRKASRNYRNNRFNAVNDTHAFGHRDRETVYLKSKYPENYDYSRYDKRYDNEKLYVEDRKSPYGSDDVRNSPDQRGYSESRDSCYDSSWDCSRRFKSESEYSHDDNENRYIDKTARSVHQFCQRDSATSLAGSSCSSPPQQEGKPKKGLGHIQHNRKQPQYPSNERKPRFTPPADFDEDESKKRLKTGQQEREELAHAMGFSDRQNNRHHRNHRGGLQNYN